MRRSKWLALTLMLILLLTPMTVRATPPATDHFERTWERTDRPVAEGDVSRTWMWGPEAFSVGMSERYLGSFLPEVPSFPNQRLIQYFDKSRMEITDPNGDPSSPWYVTNGLLVVELITGRMQVGDNSFQERLPATVNVAGDYDDPQGPTYASFSSHLDDGASDQESAIVRTIDREGVVSENETFAAYNVGTTHYVQETGHWIAEPFWNFMNSSGLVYEDETYTTAPLFLDPFYATGFPVTDSYWANVKVGGTYRDVLMQCFERRCLTYTPDNPAGWQVEAGNVGQHYYSWRYGWGLAVGSGDYALTTSIGEERLLGRPTGVASAPDDTIIVADRSISQLLRFDTTGQLLQRIGGTETDTDALITPRGVAIDDDGNIYVTDSAENRVLKYASDGRLLLVWGAEGDNPAEFNEPLGVAVSSDGRVYVADAFNYRVQVFDDQGNYLNQWGGAPSDANGFSYPEYPLEIAVGPSGTIFVTVSATSGENDRVERFTPDGSYLGEWRLPSNSEAGIAVDLVGTVYVADAATAQILRFESDGSELPPWDLSSPSESGSSLGLEGIALDSDGRLYIAESSGHRVIVLDRDGNRSAEWSRQGLISPVDVVTNGDGTYFVGDNGTRSIFHLDASGAVINEFGQGVIGSVSDLDLTASGKLWVLDEQKQSVHRFSEAGIHEATVHVVESLTLPPIEFLPAALAVDPVSNDFYILTRGIYHPAHGRSSRIYHFASNGSFITSWIVSQPRDKDPEPAGYGLDLQNEVLYTISDTAGIAAYLTDGAELMRIPGFSADGIAAGEGDTLWLNRNVPSPDGEIEYHVQQVDLKDGTIIRDWVVEGTVTNIWRNGADIVVSRSDDPAVLLYSPNASISLTMHP